MKAEAKMQNSASDLLVKHMRRILELKNEINNTSLDDPQLPALFDELHLVLSLKPEDICKLNQTMG